MNKKQLIIDFSVLFCICIFFFYNTTINALIPNWDFFNYKLYNLWAFENNRLGIDIIASNLRTCYNPIIDLPEYFLMHKLNEHPLIFLCLCVLDSILLMFCVYKISDYVFKNLPNKLRIISVIFSVIFIINTPRMFSQMSFDSNDVKIGLLCIIAIIILVKATFKNFEKTNLFINENTLLFLSGCLFGCTTGLKLTAFEYTLTAFLFLLIFHKYFKNPVKSIILYCLGVFTGFLITDGWWLYKCYLVYKNPFFPYFNNLFQSPFADSENIVSIDYGHLLPKNIFQFVFYPFLYDSNLTFGADNRSFDIRIPITYISLIILSPILVFSYFKDKSKMFCNIFDYKIITTLIIFIAVPYFINLSVFGTNRYLMPSASLSSIVIFVLLYYVLQNFKTKYILLILLLSFTCILAYYTQVLGYAEGEIARLNKQPSDDFSFVLNKEPLNFVDDSIVIFGSPATSFNAFNENKKVKYVGFVYPKEILKLQEKSISDNKVDFYSMFFKSDYYEKYIEEIILSDKKIYMLYSQDLMENLLQESLDYYNSKRKNKRILTNCNDISLSTFNAYYHYFPVKKCDFNPEE